MTRNELKNCRNRTIDRIVGMLESPDFHPRRLFQAIFVLDDDGEATGIVHPFHDNCARSFRINEEANANELLGPASRYAWGNTDESQHDDHVCVACCQPMKVGA